MTRAAIRDWGRCVYWRYSEDGGGRFTLLNRSVVVSAVPAGYGDLALGMYAGLVASGRDLWCPQARFRG